MSTAVASVSLQTAVLDQVKWFANAGTTFSVHDVTRSIRTKVAQGELEIPETEIHGSSFRNDIPHTKVKSLFDDLWRTGAFDPFLSLNRQFNGTYFEYTPTSVACTQAVPSPANIAVQTPTITPVTTVAPPTPINDADVKARIKTYLDNCANRNFRPTIKQTQSACKRNSGYCPTCEELKLYIVNMGYTIVDEPDALSRSQVIV